MDFHEKIMQLANITPVQPINIARALSRDSFTASAMLSELVGKGKLKISHLKLGSSPLYYVPEKSSQLKDYIKYLNDKDQKTAKLLEEEKILRENEQDPLTKVSLKSLKDFAMPLEVQLGEQKEIFWKWYLITNSEAEEIIKQKLNIKKQEDQTEHKPSNLATETKSPETKEELPKKIQEKQHKLTEKTQETKPISQDFFKQAQDFFKQNNITINEHQQIKKNTEYFFDIQIKTPVGELNYYCIVKNKKRITDSDITNTFVQAQMKKLPALLISEGELTKKATELLKQLKGITFKKI